jgi:peptide/nickel transport system ATP-binding protein
MKLQQIWIWNKDKKMQPLLFEMKEVTISYQNKQVVSDVSFSVGAEEILGIVGESGSGKSTLIKAAIGLLGRGGKIESGKILYKGLELNHLSPEKYRKLRGTQMGMIFQDCKSSLSPIRTIEAQVYEAMSQHIKINRNDARNRAQEILDRLKLPDSERILKSYPFELSGGMNQRVGIMIAILLKPTLLFADEPTSALDVLTQAQVVSELMELKEELKTSIVIVTHNMGVVSHMTDQVIVMKKGRQVEYGLTKEILKNPQNEYTKQLLSAVPRIRRG